MCCGLQNVYLEKCVSMIEDKEAVALLYSFNWTRMLKLAFLVQLIRQLKYADLESTEIYSCWNEQCRNRPNENEIQACSTKICRPPIKENRTESAV